jgi:tryptophanase
VAYGLAIELIRQYGIRTVELSYLGGYLDVQYEKNGNKLPERMPNNFIRMTVPAYAYHKEHLEYVVNALAELLKDKSQIPSVNMVGGRNDAMRAFSLVLEPVYPPKK